MELSTLLVAHLRERRVADDLPDRVVGSALATEGSVPGERRISLRLKIAADRSGVATFYRFNEDRLARRGVRVAVTTRRRGRTLRYTDRLPAPDNRYCGE